MTAGLSLLERAAMNSQDQRTKEESGEEVLERAFDGLEQEAPDFVVRVIAWVRNPTSRWVRIPIGLLFIVASFFWFLPVVGVEFFPIGLLFIAQDIPFMRKPVGKLLLWLEAKWRELKRSWRGRRDKR